MSNSKILELAKEITEARDIEIPEKLLKLRGKLKNFFFNLNK